MNRALEIAAFLMTVGWDTAADTPFAADFSSRRYTRLAHSDGRRAILMDAAPDQKTPQFVKLDAVLRAIGLSAPEIYAAQPERGLVLMEDLGDQNIGGLIDAGQVAASFYRRAIDVLVRLHQQFVPSSVADAELSVFNTALFVEQVSLFLTTYFAAVKGRDVTDDESRQFKNAWHDVLAFVEGMPQTLMLRDFMPDNLMLLEREGFQNIGLLDFQDAGLGPIAYDIVSLCECVRRDVDPSLLDCMITYYVEQAQPSMSAGELRRASYILSAQRHMRILGIITQLAQGGRREKIGYLPRVEIYLNRLLQHEALESVQQWLQQCGLVLNSSQSA